MGNISQQEEIADEQLQNEANVLNRLFRKKKNKRLKKMDEIEGPLYIDPFLSEKLRNPKKCL